MPKYRPYRSRTSNSATSLREPLQDPSTTILILESARPNLISTETWNRLSYTGTQKSGKWATRSLSTKRTLLTTVTKSPCKDRSSCRTIRIQTSSRPPCSPYRYCMPGRLQKTSTCQFSWNRLETRRLHLAALTAKFPLKKIPACLEISSSRT